MEHFFGMEHRIGYYKIFHYFFFEFITAILLLIALPIFHYYNSKGLIVIISSLIFNSFPMYKRLKSYIEMYNFNKEDILTLSSRKLIIENINTFSKIYFDFNEEIEIRILKKYSKYSLFSKKASAIQIVNSKKKNHNISKLIYQDLDGLMKKFTKAKVSYIE